MSQNEPERELEIEETELEREWEEWAEWAEWCDRDEVGTVVN